ncbi:hypothetical protein ASZ90_004123 [hydrocarbon metagenome]|uniref:J domain-containing protein n=1 Tax=hydrocarbon metagenome TaxID=938273 RepID=A0A0W8FZ27_9ZZZZ
MKCNRCGLNINFETKYCSACGNTLTKQDELMVDINYYELFELSPNSTLKDIEKRMRALTRFWGNRANISSKIEQRHEAERMLQYLSKAELILLDPQKRTYYDQSLFNKKKAVQKNKSNTPTPIQFSTQENSSNDFFTNNSGETIPEIYSEDIQIEQKSNFRNFFWYTILKGTVVNVDPTYMSHPDFRWDFFLIKIVIFVVAVFVISPIIIGIMLGLIVASAIFSFMFPSRTRHGYGFLSSILSHMLSFIFTKHLLGQKEMVSVRDIRLRDHLGQEHLIRIKGEIVSGNINVGDEIEVEGFNRGGTIMFRRGWNKRIRSEIRVKRR